MIISEIFKSIDGESKRAGELAIFIRSVGCNLRCSYCDSKYTWEIDSTAEEMSVQTILKKCNKLNCKNITFTGGEPLIQKDADELIDKLSQLNYNVGIETDGAVDFTTRDWFINNDKNVWLCVDYKCPSSDMNSKMIGLDKFAQLRDRDVVKFVVGSNEDLECALQVIQHLRSKDCRCYFYLSPVFGKIKPVKIVQFMMKHNLQNKIRFQLQLHKFVWDPQQRGV